MMAEAFIEDLREVAVITTKLRVLLREFVKKAAGR